MENKHSEQGIPKLDVRKKRKKRVFSQAKSSWNHDSAVAIKNELHKNNLYGWYERDFVNYVASMLAEECRANPEAMTKSELENYVLEFGIWRYLDREEFFYNKADCQQICDFLKSPPP